jgi:outer-membrane receptor for ferric coprogen and ferric-rhodotorulic acid
MSKSTLAVLAGTAAWVVAYLPAHAQSTAPNNSNVTLSTVNVEAAKPKKVVRKAKAAPAQRTPNANRTTAEDGNTTGETQPNPAPVRDTRADTDGKKSYTSEAITTVSKEPRTRREVPHTVSVITRQQMNDQNMNTVWETLAFAPGVTLVSNNPDQGQYHARGYALGVMYDGVPSYNALSGYQQLDMAIYDRVEVLRGPAGLFMGSGNPSGVVNMVRKRPHSEPGVAWSTSYGSWNNKHAELDVTTPLNESKTLRVRGVIAGTGKDYFFDDADETRILGYGVLEYDLTPNTLVTASVTSQRYDGPSYSGLPAYTDGRFLDVPRSTNVYPSWTFLKWDTKEYATSVEHHFANEWRAKVSTRLLDQTFHFNDAYPTTGVNPATMTANYAERDAIYDYQRLGVDAYIDGPFHLFGQKHNLLLGYNYDRFTTDYVRSANITVKDVPILNPDSVLPRPSIPFTTGGESINEQSGFYGQARFKLLDPLTAVVGGRITDFDSKSRNRAPSPETPWAQGAHAEGEVTPYGALLLDLNKNFTLYGSYADIFMPQTVLKYTGETLDPRVGGQYEVGLKGEFFDKRLQTSLAVFDIRDKNRSYFDVEHSTPSQSYFLQLGEAESKGVDAEISGQLFPGLDIMAGYTFLHTEILKDKSKTGTSEGLPISTWYPEHTVKAWAKYQFQSEELKPWCIGLGVIAMSSAKSGSSAPYREQEPYAVVNAQIGYQFDKNLSATFSVNNIFDEAYYTRLGGLNTYNTYGEPRNFMLTLRKTFD